MPDSISLAYKDGSSDKVYQASIEASGTGYVVNFAYGRRGSALTTGSKTNSPVDMATAKKVYDKLVKEKMAKGYKQEGASGVIQTIASSLESKRDTGIHPQLLNPIEEDEVRFYIANPRFCLQEKHDGRRLLIKAESGKFTGINRKGQEIPLKADYVRELRASDISDCILDGEDCGDTFWVFDCLMLDGRDMSQSAYRTRYNAIKDRFAGCIKVTQTYWTEKEKSDAYHAVKRANAEGVVFKNIDSIYVAGRPASGGSQLKYKFYATATCQVDSQNGAKRSVSLKMACGTDVGNVTIPANFDIPNSGDLVEIRYLYAYKGGSLYQPVYLGKRDDLDEADKLDLLKLKRDVEEDAE